MEDCLTRKMQKHYTKQDLRIPQSHGMEAYTNKNRYNHKYNYYSEQDTRIVKYIASYSTTTNYPMRNVNRNE